MPTVSVKVCAPVALGAAVISLRVTVGVLVTGRNWSAAWQKETTLF